MRNGGQNFPAREENAALIRLMIEKNRKWVMDDEEECGDAMASC